MKKKKNTTCWVCGIAAALALNFAQADLITKGTYDPDDKINLEIDAGKLVSSSISLSTFRPLVESAFTNNTGGVANFSLPDDLDEYNTGQTPGGRLFLGVDQNLSVDFSMVNVTLSEDDSRTREPISGTRRLQGVQNTTVNHPEISFSNVRDGAGNILANAGVTHFGIGFVHRNDRPWLGESIAVTFTDASSQVINDIEFENVSDTRTFIGFEAPSGTFISSIKFVADGENRDWNFALDEMGVVAIPEPTTITLLGIALFAGLLGFRRRK